MSGKLEKARATDKNPFFQQIAKTNAIARSAVGHHSVYPFRQLSMTCKRSVEAKQFYLQILRDIEFATLLPAIMQELIVLGEAILAFEGTWSPPQFLDPNHVELMVSTDAFGHTHEQIHYKVEEEIRERVLNTHPDQDETLQMDAYTIRQIRLGQPLNLSRSPRMKLIHIRRRTADASQTLRGISYFDPVYEKLVESENLKREILATQHLNNTKNIQRIRELDLTVFEYCFPNNLKVLENELKYLQELIRFFLLEEIFKPAAFARQYVDSAGPILPELTFQQLDLNSDEDLKTYIKQLRDTMGVDTRTVSMEEYLRLLKNP